MQQAGSFGPEIIRQFTYEHLFADELREMLFELDAVTSEDAGRAVELFEPVAEHPAGQRLEVGVSTIHHPTERSLGRRVIVAAGAIHIAEATLRR
ncbi:hypothetical protein MAUB_52390 [Mycolicibacterium aubagnense]|uniref:Uncharacterized protein n=1 Tax=Mycolicibacterium aubagnense TaxID=319707 RepID=A0ABN5Z287_9MYCO|nr:hypothetical protein MAUB_52390 [Mycolicibacterium aubagnense]